MCDKPGNLPIFSFYPSFKNIPDRKVKTWKEEFSLDQKEIYLLWGKNNSP